MPAPNQKPPPSRREPRLLGLLLCLQPGLFLFRLLLHPLQLQLRLARASRTQRSSLAWSSWSKACPTMRLRVSMPTAFSNLRPSSARRRFSPEPGACGAPPLYPTPQRGSANQLGPPRAHLLVAGRLLQLGAISQGAFLEQESFHLSIWMLDCWHAKVVGSPRRPSACACAHGQQQPLAACFRHTIGALDLGVEAGRWPVLAP